MECLLFKSITLPNKNLSFGALRSEILLRRLLFLGRAFGVAFEVGDVRIDIQPSGINRAPISSSCHRTMALYGDGEGIFSAKFTQKFNFATKIPLSQLTLTAPTFCEA